MRGWPFAGRDVELDRLGRLVSDPAAGGVVLAGPAGVGKTRLGLELLERATAAGLATERVMATKTRAELPFGAVAMLLPELGRARAAGEPAELVRALAGEVLGRAGGRRLALLVDDANLLDEGSAMLIQQLVMTGSVFVIATVRTGEAAPGPVVALWKEDLAERVDLHPLSDAAIEETVSAFLGGPVAGAVITSLARRSRGNMLFVRELVHGALAEETLRSEGGIWHLVGELHPSDRLAELLETRLADADPVERELLELLAVGEPLAEAELDALATEEIVDRLEQKGLISTSLADGRYGVVLAHPLYGDVLRAGLSAGRSRRLTRRLAEVVESVASPRPDDLLRVAAWRLKCGGGEPGALTVAAGIAFDRCDDGLAESLAQAAIEAGAGFPAQLLLADATARQGDRAGAEAQLAQLWHQAADDEHRIQVVLARVFNALMRGRAEEAGRLCDEALTVVADPVMRAAIGVRRSWAATRAVGPRAGLEAMAAVEEVKDDATVADRRMGDLIALTRLGRSSEALRLVAAAEAAQHPVGEFNWASSPSAVLGFFRCEALAAAGRLVEMEDAAMTTYQSALSGHSLHGQALGAYQLAQALAMRGRVRRAIRYAREAQALLGAILDTLTLRGSLHLLASVAAIAGEDGAAAEAMAQAAALQTPDMWDYIGSQHAGAWVAASSGDLRLARELLEEEVAIAEGCGDLVRTGTALHSLVRLGYPRPAGERLRSLAAEVEGDLSTIRADHAEALAARQAEGLDAVSLAFEACGADLWAAEAACDAAVTWRRLGESRKAGTAEHRAATLLDRCEGASTPATSSIETRARLTPAERETAVLAAEGRANKEIAAELHVSVRTVESRLQNVYTKLGISRREDLRSQLARPGSSS